MSDVFCSHTEMVDIEKLIPNPRNPNKHPDKQIGLLAKIIDAQGWRAPITVSKRSGFIVRGHGRLMAAQKLGLSQVPVDYQDYESEAAEWADLIADNRLSELSDPDVTMLKDLLQEIDTGAIDMELTAYTADEIEAMINGDAQVVEDDFDAGKALDEIDEPATKLGDIYLLGNHRLMCGDSTVAETVAVLMDGHRADMVFTDPPYRIETEGGCKGNIGHSLKKQGSDIAFIADFNPALFLAILPTLFNKNTVNAYVFCNKDLLPEYLQWAVTSKISFNVLVWKKPNAIPIGDSHRPDIEYMLLFRKNAIWNNAIPGVNYSRVIEASRETGLHPTMKPIEIICNEMKISSNVQNIVLDLFGGSGSTLIACEQLSRRCYMMEMDPKYCDVIVKRWETLTGNKAELLRR